MIQPRGARLACAVALALALTGCSLDSLLKKNDLPPNLTDPAITQTPQGAVAAYNGTLAQFRVAFGGGPARSFAVQTGLLGDELLWPVAGVTDPVDRRLLPPQAGINDVENLYRQLHRVRGDARQAIGLLNAYLPEQPALAGHAYALAGYAEVFLAELYCSGIPLSTVDFGGDYTYRPGSTTAEVLIHARTLFDSALTLVGDSAQFLDFAAVGKARALLALGDYPGAAAAVTSVPDDYRYQVTFASTIAPNFAAYVGSQVYGVADQKGTNGLDYLTSSDPRIQASARGSYTLGSNSYTLYHPDKYARDGSSPMMVASGVEARLIEAEAALQAGDATTWLAKLNALRTNGTQDGGGVYQPGTGGVAGLAPLADPGSVDGRVDLLFRERAFWLFLTGHRQGDLRRLIRQYGRTQNLVYPAGAYPNDPFGGQYGSDVTLPVPPVEATSNPLFTGCISRAA